MFEEFLLSCILESCWQCMFKLLMTWIWGEGERGS